MFPINILLVNDISLLDSFLETHRPDILLMDINLKNIASEDGLEWAECENKSCSL